MNPPCACEKLPLWQHCETFPSIPPSATMESGLDRKDTSNKHRRDLIDMNLQIIRRVVRKLTALAISAVAFAILPVKAPAAVMTLTNIFSFPTNQYSGAGLAQGTNGNFYGTTLPIGTNDGDGNVFMLTSTGVFTNLFTFSGGNGSMPNTALTLAQDGNFYGTTSRGGSSNYGTIFSISQAGRFTFWTNFNGGNGAYPIGGLTQATNQVFYGTTYSGGAYGFGSIFAFSVTNGLSSIYSFTGTNDGAFPVAGVVFGPNGNLYGTTYLGGTNELGTVFEVNTVGNLTTLVSLTFTNGAFPVSLVSATNGTFFGAAFSGGSNGFGDIFEIPANATTASTLASFDITNGSNPDAQLIIGSDGLLYGTTVQGGTKGDGLVFQVSTNVGRFGHGGVQSTSTNGALSAEDSFQNSLGTYPQGRLLQGEDGNFYGTTTSGGANGTGTVFEVVGFAPTILIEPTNIALTLKSTAVFSVQAGGSSPLSYQWLFDGTNLTDSPGISGSTNYLLTIGPEVLTDSGDYSVIVSNAFGKTTSAVAILTVPAPTITITAPPGSGTNQSLVIKGTATGKFGVTNVFYQVLYQTKFGSNWTAVSPEGWQSAPAKTNWSITALLQGGSNFIEAYTVDPLGNPSLTNTVETFYTTHSLFNLITNAIGWGTITPKESTNLVVGDRYTLTATAAKNYIFSNWSGSVLTTSNPLSFLMVSNMVISGNFVPNPFLITNVAGPFNGLFSVSNNVSTTTAGLLQNLVIGKLGTYTAKIYVGGTSYNVAGTFNLSGYTSSQVTRSFALGSLTVVLNLNWNVTPPQITGTVSGKDKGGWTASLLAEPAGKGLSSAQYTVLIPPGTNLAVASPPGAGYASITNHDGTATITGALPDGTAFSQSIAESLYSNLFVYITPYSDAGLLMGKLTISNGSPQGELTLIRPEASTGLYPFGYTNNVTVLSSPWVYPGKKNVPPLDLQLNISNSLVTNPLAFNVALNFTNGVITALPGGPTNTLTGTFNTLTGLMKITFENGHAKQTSAATAVVLQNISGGGGYFTTSTNSGTVSINP
jgi:uncharacterized repeat protein (TIGR03803 family)